MTKIFFSAFALGHAHIKSACNSVVALSSDVLLVQFFLRVKNLTTQVKKDNFGAIYFSSH